MSDFKARYGEEILSVEGRFVYPKLAEPDTVGKFARGNFNTTFLVSKEDIEGDEFKAMMAALCEVAGVASEDDLDKHPFCGLDGNLKDGDAEKNASKPGFPGHIFMKVSTNEKPECFTSIDVDESTPIDADKIKAGDYGRLILTPSCYGEGETTFYIKAVLLTKVGERLSGGGAKVDAKSFFDTAVSGGGAAKAAPKKKKAKPSINDVLG